MFRDALCLDVTAPLGRAGLPFRFAAARDLAVHQPAHRLHPFPVLRPVLAVHPRQRLKPPQPPDGMFHPDASARKRGVIRDIFGGAFFAAQLFARRGSQPRRVQVRHSHVGQIAPDPHAVRYALRQARFLEQGDVGRRPPHAWSHIDNLASILINGNLALDGVLIFLAAIPGIGFAARLRALDALLEAIHDDQQGGHGRQQLIAPPARRALRAGQDHTGAPVGGQEGQAAGDYAGGGGVTDPKQPAEDLMGGILAQPKEGEQQLVAGIKPKRMAAANGPPPSGRVWRAVAAAS